MPPARRRTSLFLIILATIPVVGCAATSLQENALEQVGTVENIRYSQLLTNVSNQIDRQDSVPALSVINQGQASSAVGGSVSLALPAMNFSKNTRSLNPSVTTTWTDNWSLSTISDPQDLENLRALLGLLYRSDDDVAKMIYITMRINDSKLITAIPDSDCGIHVGRDGVPHIEDGSKALPAYLSAVSAFPLTTTAGQPETTLPDCYHQDRTGTERPLKPTAYAPGVVPAPPKPVAKPAVAAAAAPPPSPPAAVNPTLSGAAPSPALQEGKKSTGGGQTITVAAAQLNLLYGLVYPTPQQVYSALRFGISFKCRDFQTASGAKVDNGPFLFTRWLYWNDTPGSAPSLPIPAGVKPEFLGHFGNHDFWTTDSACVSDFIILAINSTANSHAAAQASPKSNTGQ